MKLPKRWATYYRVALAAVGRVERGIPVRVILTAAVLSRVEASTGFDEALVVGLAFATPGGQGLAACAAAAFACFSR